MNAFDDNTQLRTGYKARKPLGLKPTEERCLQLLHLHQYGTAEQLRRAIGLSHGSGSYMRELVASLSRLGLVERISRDREGPHGSLAGAYTLTTAGRRYLGQLGLPTEERYRPVEERRRSRVFLAHTLVCVDVAISIGQLAEQRPHIDLRHLWHERALRRRPSYVTTDGRRQAVIPDLLLDLDLDGDQAMLSCEVDLGSERGPAWKRKIRRLVAWAQGPYRSTYHSDSLTIAVITPGDLRRAQLLCRQTGQALDEAGSRSLATLFVFSAEDPAAVSPTQFWLAPTCLQPFGQEPVALIEGWRP